VVTIRERIKCPCCGYNVGLERLNPGMKYPVGIARYIYGGSYCGGKGKITVEHKKLSFAEYRMLRLTIVGRLKEVLDQLDDEYVDTMRSSKFSVNAGRVGLKLPPVGVLSLSKFKVLY
jgi:hypothetical protein